MVVNSSAGYLASLDDPSFIGEFYRRYEMDLPGNFGPKLGWMNPESVKETETYKMLGASPMLKQWIGEREASELELFTYQIQNELFQSGLKFTTDDVRRDKTGQINVRIGDLAMRAQDHWNKLLSTLIEDTTSLCYDGATFFSTGHSNGSSGTINNALAAAQVSSLNVTTAANPTATELAQVFVDLCQQMYGWKDEDGEPINGAARQFGVMVPTNMIGAANLAVNADRLANNDNIAKAQNFSIEVIPNPRLTGTTVLYVFRLDGGVKPFILQEEEGLQVQVVGRGSEYEVFNRKQFFGATALRAAGFGEFLYALKATLS